MGDKENSCCGGSTSCSTETVKTEEKVEQISTDSEKKAGGCCGGSAKTESANKETGCC